MTEAPSATARPWTYERQDNDDGSIYYAIHGKNYEFITNVDESKANAALIVTAVNERETLLALNEKWRADAAASFEEVLLLRARIAELEDDIANREARRVEILDWLQEQIGTAWTCECCNYSTYHAHANECANCGAEFPALNMLAFKLHASHTAALSPQPEAALQPNDGE